jgi:hypothetical protein
MCIPFITSPWHPRMNEETNKIATLNIMNLPVLSAVIGTAHIS